MIEALKSAVELGDRALGTWVWVELIGAGVGAVSSICLAFAAWHFVSKVTEAWTVGKGGHAKDSQAKP